MYWIEICGIEKDGSQEVGWMGLTGVLGDITITLTIMGVFYLPIFFYM